MKLLTNIPPRRDGTVKLTEAGVTYVFAADAVGDLVCEISDEALVARLLGSDDYQPADEADFDQAAEILAAAKAAAESSIDVDQVSGEADASGDADDLDDDDAIDPNAALVETPAPAQSKLKAAAEAVKQAVKKGGARR